MLSAAKHRWVQSAKGSYIDRFITARHLGDFLVEKQEYNHERDELGNAFHGEGHTLHTEGGTLRKEGKSTSRKSFLRGPKGGTGRQGLHKNLLPIKLKGPSSLRNINSKDLRK